MFKYAKYTLFHLLTVPFAIGITLGSNWLYLGLILPSVLSWPVIYYSAMTPQSRTIKRPDC